VIGLSRLCVPDAPADLNRRVNAEVILTKKFVSDDTTRAIRVSDAAAGVLRIGMPNGAADPEADRIAHENRVNDAVDRILRISPGTDPALAREVAESYIWERPRIRFANTWRLSSRQPTCRTSGFLQIRKCKWVGLDLNRSGVYQAKGGQYQLLQDIPSSSFTNTRPLW
jgi:hypothetical protein